MQMGVGQISGGNRSRVTGIPFHGSRILDPSRKGMVAGAQWRYYKRHCVRQTEAAAVRRFQHRF